MKIYKKNDKIIFEIPSWQDASDYFGKKDGEIPNIIGVVCNDDYGNEELGFHQLIDMTYKGKEPQIDGLLVRYNGNKENFKKLCKKLNIEYFEYPICGICKKTVYGCHTINKDGKPICFECKEKLKKIEEK